MNGTTYLPVRAVANALGKEVYWDGPNYTVYIGRMDGKLGYPSVRLQDVVNIGSGISKLSNPSDNYNNTYSDTYYDCHKFETLLYMKYT